MKGINTLSSAFWLLVRMFFSILIVLQVGLASAEEPLSKQRKKELVETIKRDCGACHGDWLRGNLGPPLLPKHLRDKPKSYLLKVIQDGVPGTPMSPLKDILSEQEIEFIVDYLLTPKTVADNRLFKGSQHSLIR